MKSFEQKVKWSLFLHDIRSVQNVASFFRFSEIFGVHKIILSGLTPSFVDRFGNERADFTKISLGSEKSILSERVGEEPQSQEFLEDLSRSNLEKALQYIDNFRKNGSVVVCIEQAENSIDYKTFESIITKYKSKNFEDLDYLIILGREREGMQKEILDVADYILEIPQYGSKESLNVFSAGVVIISRLFDRSF